MSKAATMSFSGVPIPPSSNNQYILVRGRGRTFHAPSQELKNYRKAMDAYFIEQEKPLQFAKELFAGYPLAIHCSFGFEKSRLLTKKGTFKRLDVSNRIKAIHDAFATALLIDDCNFVFVSAKKYSVPIKDREQVTVEITISDFEEMI